MKKKKSEFYYIGRARDEKIRQLGSSGGVLRALLVSLLAREEIDGALVTVLERLKPVAKIVTSPADILKSSKSIYHKFDFTPAIDLLKQSKLKKIAVVGIPCQINVYKRVEELKEKVNLYLSLFCGRNLRFSATELLLKKLKINKHDIRSIDYRGGTGYGGFEVNLINGTRHYVSKDAYNFLNVTYMDPACLNCQDFYGEEADISFGDCWFMEGYTSILARGERSRSIINDCPEIKLESVEKKKFMAQHKHVRRMKETGMDLSKYRYLFIHLPFPVLAVLAKIGKIIKKF